MDTKSVIGLVAALISIVSYISYFRGLKDGTIKPHFFSWFLWFLLMAIGYAAQVSDAAGAGSWIILTNGLFCLAVAIAAIKIGEKRITITDWIALAFALSAIPVWVLTKQPTYAAVMVSVIDAVAFYPTIRKTWLRPNQEGLTTFVLVGCGYLLSLLALDNYTIATWFYPASLLMVNTFFVAMVLYRRANIKAQAHHAL